VIIFREFVRYKLINNSYEKDKIKIGVILAIIYVIYESFTTISLDTLSSPYYIFKQTSSVIFPIVVKNVLYTYIAVNSTCLGSIIYEFVTKLLLWLSPILPNNPWVMGAIIDITIPIILFLYIRYIKNKKEIFSSKANKKNIIYLNPKGLIPVFVVCVFVIWFAIRNISCKTNGYCNRQYGSKPQYRGCSNITKNKT